MVFKSKATTKDSYESCKNNLHLSSFTEVLNPVHTNKRDGSLKKENLVTLYFKVSLLQCNYSFKY